MILRNHRKKKKDVWYYLNLLNLTGRKVFIEKVKYREKRLKKPTVVLDEKNIRKIINETVIKDTNSIFNFIDILPAGLPEGELINKYVHQNTTPDLRVSSSMERKEVIRILNKYRVVNSDRKRLIAAILNIRIDLG